MDVIDFSISAEGHTVLFGVTVYLKMSFGRSTSEKYITSASIMANVFSKQKREFMPILNDKKVNVQNVTRHYSALLNSEPSKPRNVTYPVTT